MDWGGGEVRLGIGDFWEGEMVVYEKSIVFPVYPLPLPLPPPPSPSPIFLLLSYHFFF